MTISQVLTSKEAATYLKINPQVLEKCLRQGAVPGRKVGRQWRISQLALDLWLAARLPEILTKLLLWQQIFTLGDKIGESLLLTEETVLARVKSSRRQRGLIFKSRSRH